MHNVSRNTYTRKGAMIACVGTIIGCSSLAMAQGPAGGTSGATRGGDPFADLPDSITLTGIVRDFRERNAEGGHDDFERQPSSGFGHYMFMVEDELNERGVPSFRSTGQKVSSNWRDAQGRNIMSPRDYIASRDGDASGSVNSSKTGSSTNAENFDMWFADIPGVNSSAPLSLTLQRQETKLKPGQYQVLAR